jgi:hypothetical protein
MLQRTWIRDNWPGKSLWGIYFRLGLRNAKSLNFEDCKEARRPLSTCSAPLSFDAKPRRIRSRTQADRPGTRVRIYRADRQHWAVYESS